MKIIFMGTPEFAVPALKQLIESKHEVIVVYTQKPKAAGRGMELKRSAIHELAEQNNIKVFTPDSLKSESEINEFKALKADVGVVVAYGMLLPEGILSGTKHGCINIHPSLLPRWRGAAPLQRTIMEGDTKSGVCIMKMDEGLDTGDVIIKEEFDIPPEADAGWLHDECKERGAYLTLKALELIEKGKAVLAAQSENGVTYAKKITKDDERIDFNKRGKEIMNKIRGLSPYPGANFTADGVKYKIFSVGAFERNKTGEPGKVINDRFHITCTDGIIIPAIIQKEGKQKMNMNDFLLGNKAPVDSKID